MEVLQRLDQEHRWVDLREACHVVVLVVALAVHLLDLMAEVEVVREPEADQVAAEAAVVVAAAEEDEAAVVEGDPVEAEAVEDLRARHSHSQPFRNNTTASSRTRHPSFPSTSTRYVLSLHVENIIALICLIQALVKIGFVPFSEEIHQKSQNRIIAQNRHKEPHFVLLWHISQQ